MWGVVVRTTTAPATTRELGEAVFLRALFFIGLSFFFGHRLKTISEPFSGLICSTREEDGNI